MNQIAENIKQRMSLREPLAEALDVVTRLTDKLSLKKPSEEAEYDEYLKTQLSLAQIVCPYCRDFERNFPSFAFSIATGIGKTRLMGACIAYLYLKKGIKHFFVLAPNLTLYEKLKRDFGDPSYEKYVFKGIAEFVSNPPFVVDGENYKNNVGAFSNLTGSVIINVFNISKFNTDSKASKRGVPQLKRLSEYIGKSYFEYLSNLDDLVILMDEAHRYHADASKKAIDELKPILGLEMTATPTDEKGKAFKNIVYEYNLAQALTDGKYVKIPTIAKRKNMPQGIKSNSQEMDIIKLEDAISVHEHTKTNLQLYAKQFNKPLVKPFILVVCRDTTHAKQTFDLIENSLFDGRYKGKVLQVDSTTKNDDDVASLFVSLEKPENQIEIVIHVNMLKEGWDVTNLYTIVPLRAADAPILVEQSIGRGLRLPFSGKRTGFMDIDKLTVIAHDNFEVVITKAQDTNSVLHKLSYVELEDDDVNRTPTKVVVAQNILELQEQKQLATAVTEAEKNSIQETSDARRAVWSVIADIPRLAGYSINHENPIYCLRDIETPEIIEMIKERAKQKIKDDALRDNPMFGHEEAKPRIEEVDAVVEAVVHKYVENVIEIPRMTIQKEAFKSEYKWFDLDTRLGFDLPALKNEIIRVGLVDNKDSDTFTAQYGHKFDAPFEQIVTALLSYDEIDYDDNADLIYHLAEQAIEAFKVQGNSDEELAKIVYDFKLAIASSIYQQMRAHFVVTSLGYTRPTVLPFSGIVCLLYTSPSPRDRG